MTMAERLAAKMRTADYSPVFLVTPVSWGIRWPSLTLRFVAIRSVLATRPQAHRSKLCPPVNCLQLTSAEARRRRALCVHALGWRALSDTCRVHFGFRSVGCVGCNFAMIFANPTLPASKLCCCGRCSLPHGLAALLAAKNFLPLVRGELRLTAHATCLGSLHTTRAWRSLLIRRFLRGKTLWSVIEQKG
jgi:hypothetical protein